jgi:DNA-binding transcriptional LysR family regulator
MAMLDELRHFVLIAGHGTFTAAAGQAHLTQPALSASIARLEAFVGARLFHRGAGGTRLSAAGEALLPRARAALAAVDEGQRAVQEVLGLTAGEVRLGAGATACTCFLPPLLAAFRRQHPGIVLKLRETTTPQAKQAIAAGELDLAVVTDASGEHWMDDELVLVAAPDALATARRAPFVTFPPGATSRELLGRHFPDARIVMELSGIAAVVAFVRAGVGVALVSRHAVAAEIARGTLAIVPHRATPLRRRLALAHLGVARLPPAAAALRKLLLTPPPAQGARRSRRQASPSRT